MLKRRLLTIGSLSLLTVTLFSLALPLLIAALILSLHPKLRTLPHAVCFMLGFVVLEWLGLAWLFWVWVRERHDPHYLAANRQVQMWWANGLLTLGRRIFGIEVSVTGEQAIAGPSAILLARHTSLADTVLPLLFFARPRNEGLRYILKRELQFEPCLDIGGNRLPNHFVDRSGMETQAELTALRDLVSSAGPDESVLIYPEGTRFSPAKHARLGATQPRLADQLKRWPDLLPPRLGGVGALLQANPGKDVVCLAHVGFEGTGSIRDLIDGGWLNQQIRLHFWRIPFSDLPDDHGQLLFSVWDQMQQQVTRLRAGQADP